MKKLALLLPLVFVTAAVAQETTKPDPTQSNEKTQAGKTKEISAEIVSVATDGKAVTIKNEMGSGNKTVAVDEKAVASVKTLKPGDKPTLVCRENPSGDFLVTAVKMPEKK